MPKIRAAAAKLGVDVSSDGDGRGWSGDVERRYLGSHDRSTYQVGEYRLEARSESDGQHVGGYGAVFNRQSRNLGGFRERVAPATFQRAQLEGFAGAVCRYNHDQNLLLGTVQGRTLVLSPDSVGLRYDVRLPQSRSDVGELVERGDVAHSSFAFRCVRDEWGTDDSNYPMRTLTDVDLVDVAPVVTPAYPDATAGLRSLAAAFDASEDEVRSLADGDELRRFFTRTDNRGPAKPALSGAEAMVALMARREDPWADRF
jgi:HK97 family phage prohead protease